MTVVEREIEFFDRFSALHGDYDVLGEGAYERLLEQFEMTVRPKRGERCIDLGCGTGAFTRRLHRFELQLEGMDISPGSVVRGNEQSRGERYLVGDITATALPAASYDIICYSGVLHHFDDAASRNSVLKEGLRILRPGGRLFAFDPSAQSPSMVLYRDPRSPLFSPHGKTENEVLLHRKMLKTELHQAGFSSIQIKGVSGIHFRFVDGKFARLVLPLYNLYEDAVRHSPLEDLLGTFLVTSALAPSGSD